MEVTPTAKRPRKASRRRVPDVQRAFVWRQIAADKGGGVMTAAEAARLVGISRQCMMMQIYAKKWMSLKFPGDRTIYVYVRQVLDKIDSSHAADYLRG